MSGSPILQNGKLVGAVTHVLVNDPPRATAFWRRICSWRRKMGRTSRNGRKRSMKSRRNTHKLPEKPLRLLSDYGKL
ncbi:MAG: SpoIVB peptidase S55 domain-containing protein [Flavonifractor plautii]